MTAGRNTPSRFMLKKPKMSPRLMGNLTPTQTLPFTLHFYTFFFKVKQTVNFSQYKSSLQMTKANL